jgi:hypothetical protein
MQELSSPEMGCPVPDKPDSHIQWKHLERHSFKLTMLHVTLPTPKGESNREYKADLHLGAILPTRRIKPRCVETNATPSLTACLLGEDL